MSGTSEQGGPQAGSPAPQQGASGTPGRYQRSTNGLIGAMIVLLLAVAAFVLFRGAFRDTPEYRPEPVDYLALIGAVQESDFEPVYPPDLPDGWFAKDAVFDPVVPSLDLVFHTADERTAGIRQEDESARTLIAELVGEDATEDRDAQTLVTPLGEWAPWTDTDGDHAWTAEIGDETVLVYSSGSPDDLRALVESLTTDPR